MASATVEIRALGELSVHAEAGERALPRSRKTRALLGYLALTGRAHRREQLCDLFWDVTDDPRAALRWSLSKLRPVLDLDGAPCLVATRTHVQVQLSPGSLDLELLRAAARRGFETLPSTELEALAAACRGELLEGLLLPDFDAFEAWLEAERAEARALHSRLRGALVTRFASEPERALGHARAWLSRSGAEDAQRWVERLSSEIESRASQLPAPARNHAPAAVTLGGAANGDQAPANGGLSSARAPAAVAPPATRPPATSADAPAASTLPAAPLLPAASALVGRDREISRLVLIAGGARTQRSGRIVLVLGEPGLGKTRLLEEMHQRLAPLAPISIAAAFHEAEQHRPLAPFLDAARELGFVLPPASGDAHADREQLFDTLATRIRRGTDEHGLGVLALDDAHLADSSSCELLHYVARTAARTPLLIVLACRSAELHDNADLGRVLVALRRRHSVEEIRLAPLAPDAIAALVQGETPALPIDELVRESAGNPLLALELARADAGDGGVPRTLSDLVIARVAALPEPAAALVRWAALVERGPLALLEAASREQVSDFVGALEVATRYAFVRCEPQTHTFAMAHGLVQRVLSEAVSPVRRAAMHRHIVEILGRARGADHGYLIAHHATRGERPDLAAHALLEASAQSARLGAVREAGELADRALELLPALEPTAALGIELGALLQLAQVRRCSDAERTTARLIELGLAALGQGHHEDAQRAFHFAAVLRWDAGTEAYGLARQAWHVTRVPGADLGEQARASSFMALCLALMEKQLPDAQAIVMEEEALAKSQRGGAEPVELVLARCQLHLHAGRLDEARRDAADARLLSLVSQNRLKEALALQLAIQVEEVAGAIPALRAQAEALAELALRIREGGEGDLARAALALCGTDIGTARPALAEAVERLRVLDDKRRLCWVANRWARREREHGDAAQAGRIAARAIAAARAVEAQSEAAIAACELMAAAARDADDAAFAAAEAALAELEADGTLSFEARRWIDRVTQILDTPTPAAKEPL